MAATQLHLSQVLNTEQYALNESTQTTKSREFSDALTLTFDSHGAPYLTFVYAEGAGATATSNIEVRLIIEGTVVASSAVLPFKSSGEWFPYSSMSINGLLAGSRTITLQFRSMSGGSVSLRRCRIFLFDLS